ncbi:MAG: polysaccharide deacetylase family protein [Burkholderiaceae bacterium]
MTDVAQAEPIDVAITVDDLLIWDGTPIPTGYTRESIVDSMIRTFQKHKLSGIYGFPHTAPLDQDHGLISIFNHWCDSGHHLANHTHCHACLNWVSAKTYCDDIRRAEEHIGHLIEKAPKRFFRYAMDMSGEAEKKRGEVEDFLQANGYENAPITSWFGDFAWLAPYYRAIESKDTTAGAMLQKSFVDAALFQLHNHAQAARQMFGRDLPYIWLIHATPIAADMLDTLINAFKDAGVRFVSLEDAMRDPVHKAMPRASKKFRNHLQRYALMQGVEMQEVPQEVFSSILNAAPMPGIDSIEIYDTILRKMCERASGRYEWEWG